MSKNVIKFPTTESSEMRKHRMVNELLILALDGDPQLNRMCEIVAMLRSCRRAFVALENEGAFFMVGQHGFDQMQYPMHQALPLLKNLTESVEYLDVPAQFHGLSDASGGNTVPRYLHIAPMVYEGVVIGYCGIADDVEKPACSDVELHAMETMAMSAVERLRTHAVLRPQAAQLFGLL